eukprot:CAMPEP_0117051500 /NCGR_PEP_ID=MMETSP0472-20121206/35576_1 /TAXON_ID=693140 ORGANISM="Tiarina fusus, Strain LIS" /NCGR_SAMPLE_ID=MMETSP0472 /ASSEMBLY_ACC=CAM_ASM_000603 /LENGTH=82 /DNA_ID=CAMNT_0004765723 /DNA_START=56 /DNA_END=300 /DNA_ORIENTATION=+
MKYINGLSLLAALPAAMGSLLRGSGADIEATVFGAHRNLQDCVDGSFYGGDDATATCCMPDQIDHSVFTHGTTELYAHTSHA